MFNIDNPLSEYQPPNKENETDKHQTKPDRFRAKLIDLKERDSAGKSC